MVSTDFKLRIIEAVIDNGSYHVSDSKQARSLGINPSQLSRIKKGDTDKVLSDSRWIHIARKLDVSTEISETWYTAQTPTYSYVYSQLGNCQSSSVSGLLCDIADIGKSYAAKCYARDHKNAVYVDCSQVKSKQRLVRKIAQEFGLDNNGRYADVYADLVYYLRTVGNPLVILDEAGDLDYPAFLELKALWNATEHCAGWYMMGADGLKVKIDRNLACKKVGYTEIFSRFGNRYQKISPDGGEELEEFKRLHTSMIAKVNSGPDVQQLYAKTGGSLRRVHIEIIKMKRSA